MSDSVCASCNDQLPDDNDFVFCTLRGCKLHYQCAGVTEKTYRNMRRDRREKYVCVLCKNKDNASAKSSLGDLSTHSGDSVSNQAGNISLDTLYRKICDFETKVTNDLKNVVTMSYFQNEIKGLQTSVDFFSGKIDDFIKELSEANSRINDLQKSNDTLVIKNRSLEKQVSDLGAQVEDLQQYSRNSNLQINGVPEIQNENVFNVVNKLAIRVDEPIVLTTDIQAVHRIGAKVGSRPRPIIVRFSNRQKKERVLDKCKKTQLQTTDFVDNVPPLSVFVNEHLTPYNKTLLFEAKKYKFAKKVQFVWVRGSKVYVRQSEEAEARRITKVADLVTYFGVLPAEQRHQ